MARAKLREIAAGEDPKEALLGALGDISGLEIFHNQVLVATYIGPEKTLGGIILPDKSLAENRFQGKVGLVVKLGPLAFRDDEVNGAFFGDVRIEVGDWVFFRPADGMELFSVDKTGGVPCRVFRDIDIKGRVSDPGMLW
jgi:co-chaperonin GroES (HSP10)